jgi:hypothetical protein
MIKRRLKEDSQAMLLYLDVAAYSAYGPRDFNL